MKFVNFYSNKFPLGALTPKTPQARISYGKKRARRRKGAAASQECNKGHRCGEEGGNRACDWRPFNEKRLNKARTGLFIQNLSETEHAGDYKRVGICILESPKDLGCFCLLYTSPSPRDGLLSRMPSSA